MQLSTPLPFLTRLYYRIPKGLREMKDFKSWIASVRRTDQFLGPGFLFWITVPIASLDFCKMLPALTYLEQLRRAMPNLVWPLSPLRHLFYMIRAWQECLVIGVSYDRLRRASWVKRIKIQGFCPDTLPEWGKKPVIVTFLHSAGYTLLRSTLRARGIPAVTQVMAVPEYFWYHPEIYEAGDRMYRLTGVPHFFTGPNAVREAVRWLVPGHVLIMALDGGAMEKRLAYDVEGRGLYLNNGAVRLAQKTGAMVVPATVHRTGRCAYEIHFGSPVPENLLQEADAEAAMTHLAKSHWRELESDLNAMTWTTLEAFSPSLVGTGVI